MAIINMLTTTTMGINFERGSESSSLAAYFLLIVLQMHKLNNAQWETLIKVWLMWMITLMALATRLTKQLLWLRWVKQN